MASPSDVARIIAREALLHRRFVLGVFIVVSIVMTAVGMEWKKTYASHTTVLFEQKSIFEPLMEGAAVQSVMADRAKIAREIVYGRSIMQAVAEQGGYFTPDMDASDHDLVLDTLRQKTVITNVGENLIKIEFSDPDPQRAFTSTKLMGDRFIAESLQAGSSESQTALEFVDGQAKEYQEKLRTAREAVEAFNGANIESQVVTPEALNIRIAELRAQLGENRVQLKEAEIRKASLEKQLAGERAYTTMTQSGDRAGAIALKEAELARLRLGYQEAHPDVVRLKQEIAELRRGGMVAGGQGPTSLVSPNPIHQTLRQELYQTTTLVSTLTSRVAETEKLLEDALTQARSIDSVQNRKAELQRNYEMTRDVYQDLLRRRETAKVSFDLNREQQGLTLKVVEPAFVPGRPKGLGLKHFAAGGLLFGLLLPLGFLYWRQQLDPKIRDGSELRGELGGRMLGVIPHLATPVEAQAVARSYRMHALAGAITALLVVFVALFGQLGGVLQ